MKTVVFDFGAVLFHWQPVELLQQVLPDLAPDETAARRLAADIFQSFHPDSDWARFDLGTIEVDALAERIAARIGTKAEAMRTMIEAVPHHLRPMDDSVALLHELKARGYRMCFLSNMPHPYAEHLERSHDIVQQFHDGIFSARVEMIKPRDEIFHLARQRFSLEPAQTVFLDDSLHNIDAARRHGWQAIHFSHAAQARAELVAGGWLEA
jgi:epoxide hydrolase-like predicted phosphatase